MEELRASSPVAVGHYTLVPIERWVIQGDAGTPGCWLYGARAPVAVVIQDGLGARAFDMHATEVAIDTLVELVPDLDDVLSRQPR